VFDGLKRRFSKTYVEKRRARYMFSMKSFIDPVLASYAHMRFATRPELGIPLSFIREYSNKNLYAYVLEVFFSGEFSSFKTLLIYHQGEKYLKDFMSRQKMSLLMPSSPSLSEDLSLIVKKTVERSSEMPKSILIISQLPSYYLHYFLKDPRLYPDKPWTKIKLKETTDFIPGEKDFMRYISRWRERERNSYILFIDRVEAYPSDLKEKPPSFFELFFYQHSTYVSTIIYFTSIHRTIMWRTYEIATEEKEEEEEKTREEKIEKVSKK